MCIKWLKRRVWTRWLNRGLIRDFLKQQEEIMAAIDDLNSSVAALQVTADKVLEVVNSLKNQPNNDAAISAASASINEVVTKLNAVTQ